jgi:hypothetical protein
MVQKDIGSGSGSCAVARGRRTVSRKSKEKVHCWGFVG